MLFVPETFALDLIIPAHVCRWLFEYLPYEKPSSEKPSQVQKNGDYDAYARDVEGKGDWNLSSLTDIPDLGHLVLILFD